MSPIHSAAIEIALDIYSKVFWAIDDDEYDYVTEEGFVAA